MITDPPTAETSVPQDYVRKLLKQWRREELAARRRPDPGLMEAILLSAEENERRYDLGPINDSEEEHRRSELRKRAVKYMDHNAKVNQLKMKLPTTPRRVAIEYLMWAHGFLLTEEPDPLPRLRKRMQDQIHAHIGDFGTASVTLEAERGAFCLIDLYALAVTAWIEAAGTTLLLISPTLATGTRLRGPHPALSNRLFEQRERLSVYAAVVEKIETEDLGATVRAPSLRDSLALVQQELTIALELMGARESSDVAKVLDTSRASAQAQEMLAALRNDAWTRASLEGCHRSALSLAQSQMTMLGRIEDFKIWRRALQENSEHGSPTRSAPIATASRRQNGKRLPSRRSRVQHD